MTYRNILYVIAVFLVALGCKTKQHVIYQSRANLEYRSDIKHSELKKILLEDGKNSLISRVDSREYSIFYAVDNGERDYVLFIPTRGGISGEEAQIEEHRFAIAIPFSIAKTEELLSVINTDIQKWNQEIEDETGQFSTFNYTPSYETVSRADSTFYYNLPSFSYNYSKSEEGSSSSLTLNRDQVLWHYTIKKRDGLITLRNLLRKAKSLATE